MAQQQRRTGEQKDRKRTATAAQRDEKRPTGRRARQRAEQAQAERRRRLTIGLGLVTVLVVVVIGVAAVLLNRPSGNGGGLAHPEALNPAANMLSVGSAAPDFNLATVDGQHYRLSALRGHPVLLEFFAVWCPVCQGEQPILNQIDATYTPTGLHSLSILANPYGPQYDISGRTNLSLAKSGDIAWFKKTFGVRHPILIDPSFATVNTYGANAYPTIYVLDRHGVIRSATQGHVPYQQLAAAVQAAGK